MQLKWTLCLAAATALALPPAAFAADPEPIVIGAALAQTGPASSLADGAKAYVRSVTDEAALDYVDSARATARGGRIGIHSQVMGYLLAELQHVARSHPDATAR